MNSIQKGFLGAVALSLLLPTAAIADGSIATTIMANAKTNAKQTKMPDICINDGGKSRIGLGGYIVSFPAVIDEALGAGQGPLDAAQGPRRFSQKFQAQNGKAGNTAALSLLIPKTDTSPAGDPGTGDDGYGRPQRKFAKQNTAAAAAYTAVTGFIAADVWPFNVPPSVALFNKDGSPVKKYARDYQVFVVLDPNGVNVSRSFGMDSGNPNTDSSKRAANLLTRIGAGGKLYYRLQDRRRPHDRSAACSWAQE